MPTIQVYLSARDRAWLDERPREFNVAAFVRDAIAQARSEAERCAHDRIEAVCLDCGEHLGATTEADSP
ncbi:MAG: hypothetical protein FWC87_01170 [Acidimicrobiaceae bacterium]|nr:hypothetical protein [Acidimicrobiaceae bacterium]